MSDNVRFFFDMDGTLCKWKSSSFEDLLQKGFFRDRKPSKNIIEAARILSDRHSVWALSAYLEESDYAKDEKDEWCNEFTPFIPAERRLFVPTTMPKVSVVPNGVHVTDILVDDYTVNLLSWQELGTGVKFMNGVNHSRKTWKGDYVSHTDSPEDIANKLEVIAFAAASRV